MSLQTVSLRPDTSMIEVMRRFRAQPAATILRAKHTRGRDGANDFWRLQFIGPQPQIADLLHEEEP